LFDRYEIQDVIGVGGMGSVYRARDNHFPNVVKLVAVKEMINQAPDPVIRQTIIQNFDREANILVTLNHPSIPKIFDYFSIDERSYLVIEYIQGKDLEAIITEHQDLFREDQVISWAIELCDVLDYLHNHKPDPIIFRDMKPSNVMINQQNHVMLVDYGIAKVFKYGQKQTMIGTEGYSPPEQYRGEATQVADVYSLGATLHHIFTHRDPRLEAPFTFIERPIRKYNPSIAPEIESVIGKALAYEPKDRYQTAAEMKSALIQAAKKTGSLSRINLSAPAVISEQTIKPLWSFQCEDEIRGSPAYDNGVVFVGSYDDNLYAVNAADGKLLWKYPTEGGIVSKPAIQDNSVCFGSEDRRLHAVSARSGKLLWTYYTEGPIRCSPKIASGQVFFGSDDGSLYAINLATSRLTWKIDAGAPVRSSPFISSDYLYFGCESGEFFCSDFRGQIIWRSKAKKGITSSPLVYQGTVFFTSLDSIFYAMDAKSGWSIWKFRMNKGSISSPCNAENLLYVGSADEFIYCIDASSAKENWRFKADHQVSGSPVYYKNAIYCGSADGNLYCIEYKSGKLRWRYSTRQSITGTPIINNDILYIGSTDHILYALMT
jgi:serine/threonine protein kinase